MSLKGTVVPLALFSFFLAFLSLTRKDTLVYAFAMFYYSLAVGPEVMWPVSYQLNTVNCIINLCSPVFVRKLANTERKQREMKIGRELNNENL